MRRWPNRRLVIVISGVRVSVRRNREFRRKSCYCSMLGSRSIVDENGQIAQAACPIEHFVNFVLRKGLAPEFLFYHSSTP